jgi:glycosyltransferase involved in cell wall biosynthesis
MQLTILSVAYPLTEVGIDAVGGSEQILTMLDAALVAHGHRSLVIAAQGSKIQGTLIASPGAAGFLDDSVRNWGRRVHRELIKDTLAHYAVDLIHLHSLDFHSYLPSGDIPVLATLHLPPDWYPADVFHLKRKRFLMNCVSRSQHEACPRCAHLSSPIPNGVDVERLGASAPKGNFALALGRICPEKGFHFALDAAHAAGKRLVLAGQVFPYQEHLDYYSQEIAPRLDHSRSFIGPVGFTEKRRLLSEAKCLMIPSTVSETSSLVAMEALACGTPVIAFRTGALPEIIDHGVTGFLVSNVDEMSRALREVDSLDPTVCSEAARTRYSAQAMATRYIEVYERLVGQQTRQKAAVTCASQWVTNP